MPWSADSTYESLVARRIACVGNARFPPGLMAVIACRLCPYSHQLTADMFATREVLVTSSLAGMAKISVDTTNRFLDVIVRGPSSELAVFAQQLLSEVAVTVQLPRWGEWNEGSLQTDLILCSHCVQAGVSSDKITIVQPTGEVKRTDLYRCGDKFYSFARTQLPAQAAEPSLPMAEDVSVWSHERCCQWFVDINPGFWRCLPRSGLTGKVLLGLTRESLAQDLMVTVEDHLNQIEKHLRRLREAHDKWQSAQTTAAVDAGVLLLVITIRSTLFPMQAWRRCSGQSAL